MRYKFFDHWAIVNRTIIWFSKELCNFSTMKASYTCEYKLKAIEMAKASNNVSATARQLGISECNIRKWKNQEDDIRNAKSGARIVKPRRKAKYPELEKLVCQFIDEKRKKGLPFSREDIRARALQVKRELGIQSTFRASNG